jgi:hypothetical protein
MANLKEAFEYASQNPDSSFAKNLEKLASSGSLDGEAKKYGIDLTPFKPKSTLDNTKDFVVGAGKGLAKTALDVGQNLQTIGQGALLAGGVSPETVAKTGFQSLDANSPIGKALEQKLAPTNDMQKYGGYVETGAELLAGGGVGLLKDAVVGGTKLIAKGASKVAPVVKKGGESLYKSGYTPNTKEAEQILAYEASQPSLSSKLYGNGNVVGNPTFKPTLRSDSAMRAGIAGTEKQIGTQAKASADNLWSKEIAPAVEKSPVRITKEEMFAPIEERIAKTVEPSRKQALIDALDAVKDDYKAVSDFSLKEAQALKSSLDEFTPSKMFKGKDVANELKVVQHDMANAIRSKTYESLADVNIKQKYLDYGNLKELEKVGVKAISEGGLKGGFGGFWSTMYDQLLTPVKTVGGKMIYKVGDKLEFSAPKSFKGKTLREYLESVGYLLPQVGEKAINSDLQ